MILQLMEFIILINLFYHNAQGFTSLKENVAGKLFSLLTVIYIQVLPRTPVCVWMDLLFYLVLNTLYIV